MRHLAADTAADATVVHVRDRIAPQWIGIFLDRQRGTAGETNARMVARASVRIDAESFAHDSLALLNRLGSQRPHAPAGD